MIFLSVEIAVGILELGVGGCLAAIRTVKTVVAVRKNLIVVGGDCARITSSTLAQLETSLVERGGWGIDAAVGILAVFGGAVVGQDLYLLITIVLFLHGKIDGGVHLVTQCIEVITQFAFVAVEAAGTNVTKCVVIVIVAIVNFDVTARHHVAAVR